MGMFSWLTADTQESIRNKHSEDGVKTVYLVQPGDLQNIAEHNYDGYGIFGDVDAYEWLATQNTQPKVLAELSKDSLRALGIDLMFPDDNKLADIPLKFSYNKDAVYEDLPASETDPLQGYFL